MGRAGGGKLSEEVGDGVDVGKLYYGRSIALAYLDTDVRRLMEGAETVLVGDIIAQKDHGGGAGTLA